MFGIAQGAFHHQANGSLVSYHGKAVGSSLLCQEFVNAKGSPLPQYFQPRPSDAVNEDVEDRLRMRPAVLRRLQPGPNNPVLVQLIEQRQPQIEAFDHVTASAIPPDAVTASASGLDPYISPQNAAIQIDRVARPGTSARRRSGRWSARTPRAGPLGSSGSPGSTCSQLNIALDEKYPV